MTTLSYIQTQLLNVLQITPLEINNAGTYGNESIKTNNAEVTDLTTSLAADISLLLTDKISWCIAQDVTEPQFQHDQLVTPSLELLKQASQKKALWALLSSYDET